MTADLTRKLNEALARARQRLRNAKEPQLDDPQYDDPTIWRAQDDIDALTEALRSLDAPPSAIEPKFSNVVMIDKKPHRPCDCAPNNDECPHGRKRTLLTAEFSRCMVPALDAYVVMLATPPSAPPRAERAEAGVEQCFYCKEEYPRPVSLHHDETECAENIRLATARLQPMLDHIAKNKAAAGSVTVPTGYMSQQHIDWISKNRDQSIVSAQIFAGAIGDATIPLYAAPQSAPPSDEAEGPSEIRWVAIGSGHVFGKPTAPDLLEAADARLSDSDEVACTKSDERFKRGMGHLRGLFSPAPEGGATHSGRHIRPIDEGDGFSTPAIQEPK